MNLSSKSDIRSFIDQNIEDFEWLVPWSGKSHFMNPNKYLPVTLCGRALIPADLFSEDPSNHWTGRCKACERALFKMERKQGA